MDAQSDSQGAQDPAMLTQWPLRVPERSPMMAKRWPKAIQSGPKTSKGNQLGPQSLPEWSPQGVFFRMVSKSIFKKMSLTKSTNLDLQGLRKVTPKASINAGGLKWHTNPAARATKGAQIADQGIPGRPAAKTMHSRTPKPPALGSWLYRNRSPNNINQK